MKPTVKIASLLMAVLLLFSVFAAGCSLNKEWSYKTADKELPIGMYVTALQEAYNEAQSYASGLEGYDASSEKWLDMEITDSDGNKAVAKDWIKDTADRKCRELLVLESALKELGSTVDEASLKSQNEQYDTLWYTQYKDTLEKLGVSLESFRTYTATYGPLREQLFNALYGAGGKQEVKSEEITDYLTKNYARYAALPVALHESTTDEAGETKDVALSAEETKKITDALDDIAKQVNAEKDAAKSVELSKKLIDAYIASNDKLEETSLQNVTLPLENAGITDETLKKALADLKEGGAATVKTGEDNAASYFYLFRYDTVSLKENYTADNVTDDSILKKMKSKDFTAYLKDLTDKANIQKSDAVDRFSPNIFFVKQENTTGAVVSQ